MWAKEWKSCRRDGLRDDSIGWDDGWKSGGRDDNDDHFDRYFGVLKFAHICIAVLPTWRRSSEVQIE